MADGLMSGKVAVILGASAEGGIGWVTATTMAREGAKVIVAARSLDKLEHLARQTGGMAIRCDATRHADIVALADQAIAKFGKVDAALYTPSGVWFSPIEATSEQSLREAMELHFFGGFFFTQEMARAIRTDGTVVLLSSITATSPIAGIGAYSCAKGATQVLTRYAAVELAPRKIRVHCVFPGITRTPMVGALNIDKVRRAHEREIPLGRVGEASDIAETITFLCSPRAAYSTGTFVPVDGGNHLTRLPRADEMPTLEEMQAAMAGSTAGRAG
jgi:NAD(P)-dependent dehydrogenase (short-subunit alcohol dehydrogenase family)